MYDSYDVSTVYEYNTVIAVYTYCTVQILRSSCEYLYYIEQLDYILGYRDLPTWWSNAPISRLLAPIGMPNSKDKLSRSK